MAKKDEPGSVGSGWHQVNTTTAPLKDWRRNFAQMNSLITTRLERLKSELPATSENDLWQGLAPQFDRQWQEQKDSLNNAEQALHIMENEHKPLGAIGRALEGERVRTARDNYNDALAGFVMLDESLRTQTQARETLDIMVDQVKERLHLIERMEKTNRELVALSRKLEPFLQKEAPTGEPPEIEMVDPEITQNDEHLLERAGHLAKSAEQVIKDILPQAPPDQTLSGLFKTLARRSMASLRRAKPLKTEI